jgi:hypothetical protein
MVEVTSRPLNSKWKFLTKQKWVNAAGTWKQNGYQTEYIISATEELGISDIRHVNINIINQEALHIASTYWDNIKYLMRVLERFEITEGLSKHYKHDYLGNIKIENILSAVHKCKTIMENISIKSSFTKHKISQLKDSISISDIVKLLPLLHIYNSLSIQGRHSITQSLVLKDILGITERYADTKTLSRLFDEAIAVLDTHCDSLSKIEQEQLNVLIERIRNSNSVIGDIVISANDIADDVPAGYEAWRPFVSGDYTYKDALIKCVLSVTTLDYNALLTNYTVYVDLPDLQDHDVTSIPAEKTFVPFSLDFYQVPDVTITMTGSTQVVIPHIVEVTLEGFYVELRNMDNELVAGKISWQALGC